MKPPCSHLGIEEMMMLWYMQDSHVRKLILVHEDIHFYKGLQLTDWKHERLNAPTSQQNTWTPVLNFIEIYM